MRDSRFITFLIGVELILPPGGGGGGGIKIKYRMFDIYSFVRHYPIHAHYRPFLLA